ncbi:MAG: OmpH family outer membrane protein [Puniceicoccales bacterium]|jgi:Skp family chaperone for outer membrane proteins|nr:OmpH family outer membrane protein [Puniceicoccales bacterium]
MKRFLLSLAVLGALAPVAHGAQSLPSLLTVDAARVYNNYGRAERSREQFQQAVEKAQEEMRSMLDEGVRMARELQELQEKVDNPTLSETARGKFRQELEEKTEEVRKKEVEVNTFRQQTDRELAERREEFVSKHLEEIKAVVANLAGKHRAQLVLNTAGMEVLYSEAALDITEEVIKAINGK